jgi:hypothetical protein
MKKVTVRLLVAVAVLFVLSAMCQPAHAQEVVSRPVSGFAEGQIRINGGTTTQLDVALDHPMKKEGLSVATWALKGSDWSEVLIGLTKSFTRQGKGAWASITGQVGLEQNDKPWRIGTTLWMGNAKTSALLILEEGGGGRWHKAVVTRQVFPGAKVGVMSQRFVGTGGYIEVNVAGKLSYWAMIPVVKPNGALVGVRVGF